MRDLEQLVDALRHEADELPAVPLLPAVRARAAVLRRRIVAAGVAGVTLVLVAVLGVGYLALSPSSSNNVGGAKPVTDVSALVGPTWRLTSWTGADGKVVLATTDRPPTLVFDSTTAAHSDDSANTTTWIVRLHKGTLVGVEGPTTTASETRPSQAAYAAVAAVLDGTASWHITGSTLVIRTGSGASVTYSSTEPTQTPGLLMGSVWYLESWTIGGKTDAPAGALMPTLAFHDPSTAVTVGGNKTEWSVDIGAGTLRATEGPLPTRFADPGDATVETAFTKVLSGSTTWQITATGLLVRSAAGDSMIFRSDPQAVAQGSVTVTLLARHGAGVVATGQGPVPGEVDLVKLDGGDAISASSSGVELSLSGQPGRYRATAKIKDGECTPTTVQLISGKSLRLTMSCRDGTSTD
jgi:hypothetical protein